MRSPETVLVMGATGFAGSHTVEEALGRGYNVVGVARKTSDNLKETVTSNENFSLVTLDLREDEKPLQNLLKQFKPKYLIQLAGESLVSAYIKNPTKEFDDRTKIIDNILKCVARFSNKTKIIITGSMLEYLLWPAGIRPVWFSPELPANPGHPYAAFSGIDGWIAEQYIKEEGLKVVKATVFNSSGARRRADKTFDGRLYHQAVQAKKEGKDWVVIVGSKNLKRDWLDVRDWASANLAIAEKGETGQCYDVCSGESYTTEQFVGTVASFLGIKYEIIEDPSLLREGEPLEIYGNNEQLKQLGWKPNKSFEQMTEDGISWHKLRR